VTFLSGASCTVTSSADRGSPRVQWQNPTTALKTTKIQSSEKLRGKKGCWPHLWVRCLFQGGPGGHYRYPTDQVPHVQALRRTRRELAHSHVLDDVGLHLPARRSSGAATPSVALAPASRLGVDQVPPRVPWCQLPPPGSGQLGCRHVSYDTLQTAGYQSI
jgi:hypothetical protein